MAHVGITKSIPQVQHNLWRAHLGVKLAHHTTDPLLGDPSFQALETLNKLHKSCPTTTVPGYSEERGLQKAIMEESPWEWNWFWFSAWNLTALRLEDHVSLDTLSSVGFGRNCLPQTPQCFGRQFLYQCFFSRVGFGAIGIPFANVCFSRKHCEGFFF